MAREITSAKVGGFNELVYIEAQDEPGDGGANHEYSIIVNNDEATRTRLKFQKGPVPQAGANGITNEALLAVVQDRLEGFDRGPFANDDTANALDHVKQALNALRKRTTDRVARGVEGTHQA